MNKVILSIVILLSISVSSISQDKSNFKDWFEYEVGFGFAKNQNELISGVDPNPDINKLGYLNLGAGFRSGRFHGGAIIKIPFGRPSNSKIPFLHIMAKGSLNILPNQWDKFYFGPLVGYGLTTPWRTYSNCESCKFKFKFPVEMYGAEFVTRLKRFDLKFSYQHFKWFEAYIIEDPIWGNYERNYMHVSHDFSISFLLSNKTFKKD